MFHNRFYIDAQSTPCAAKWLRMRWQANDTAANEQQDQCTAKYTKSAAALQNVAKQGVTQ